MKLIGNQMKRARLKDNFHQGDAVYGATWDITRVTGTGTNVTEVDDGLGGKAELTSIGIATQYVITTTKGPLFNRTLNPKLKASITSGGLTDRHLYLGFSDSPLFSGAETRKCYFRFDYSVDNVNWWTDTTDGVDVSLGVTPLGTHILELSLRDNGDAEFKIDGILYATIAGAVGADTDMEMFFAISMETAASVQMDCNWIEMEWNEA